MIKNISTKTFTRGVDGYSSSSVADNFSVNSAGDGNNEVQVISSTGRHAIKDKPLHPERHWTVPFTKAERFAIKAHQLQAKLADEQTLTKNLAKHLRVGSNDTLNIMGGIFKFHRYDTALLRRYINDRSQKNLKALEIQIENRLFLADSEKHKPA